MESGFGNSNNLEIGELIEYKGYLYAGVRNHIDGCQIWRSKSIDEAWEMVFEDGGGNINNVWCMEFKIFNDELFVGTFNHIDGCEIFKTSKGGKGDWECIVGSDSITKSGFGNRHNIYTWSMDVYDSFLYVGTQGGVFGGELWKSKDGINWEPVIAFNNIIGAKLNGAYFPSGFGMFSVGGFRDMAVFNDELYVCTAGGFYLDIILSDVGKILTISGRIFHPRIISKFLSLGSQIWKYNSSRDMWLRVVGGEGNEADKSGFGDPRNVYFWCMEIYNNHLYVGTLHQDKTDCFIKKSKPLKWTVEIEIPKGHGELWRYDGNNWEQLVGKECLYEFDDGFNIGIREIKIYNNTLVLGTMNLNSGCEMWEITL